jgi:hypothetical protein
MLSLSMSSRPLGLLPAARTRPSSSSTAVLWYVRETGSADTLFHFICDGFLLRGLRIDASCTWLARLSCEPPVSKTVPSGRITADTYVLPALPCCATNCGLRVLATFTGLFGSPPKFLPPMTMTRWSCAGGSSRAADWSRASGLRRLPLFGRGCHPPVTGSRKPGPRSEPSPLIGWPNTLLPL